MLAQAPLNSGFSAKSTAEEVMRGVDLAGKTAIVTGGYSGIGLDTVAALAAAGARIIVPARNKEKAAAGLKEVAGAIEIADMDLGDQHSVERFAQSVKGSVAVLDILINNAGIMACPETRIGRNWEAQLATNHFGHFALTRALLPLLRAAKGARVVSLSSSGHKRTDILWNDPHFQATPYEKWAAYGQSKTANALFAVGLDAREKANGLRAFAVHPGGIMTPLQRHLRQEEMIALGWIDETGGVSEAARPFFKTTSQGAATSLWCATSARLNGLGGLYCEDCDVAELAGENEPRHRTVRPYAVSSEGAERLWALTEKALGA